MVDYSNDFSNYLSLNIHLSNKMPIRSIIYDLKYIYIVISVFYVFVCST